MIILRAVAALYLLSGLWCAVAPQIAAGFLGFGNLGAKGLAEFFTVYAGLQIGLGLAMAVMSLTTSNVAVGLLFAALFSTVLALARLISLALYGVDIDLLGMAALEVAIALVLWLGWSLNRQRSH